MSKPPEISDEEKKKLLNKARLWLILHGRKPFEGLKNLNYCSSCPNHIPRGYCRIKRDNRLGIDNKTEEIRLIDIDFDNWHCIEWVKHV